MEVKINGVATTPSSLRFGCVVTGPEKSWVQFVHVVVEDDDLDQAAVDALISWGVRQRNRYMAPDPADDLQPELPLIDL